MFELFPMRRRLPLALRVVFVLCAVLGTLVLLLTMLMIVIEITTSPGVSQSAVRITIASAAVSVLHILREASSARPLALWSWMVFLGSLGVFAWEMWTTIHDLTAKIFFLTVLSGGGLALLIARMLNTPRMQETSEHDRDGEAADPRAG